ncbi:hypothetical protein [Georgenia sp. SUBG003]|uniref:hypothetical protein n=1 Tax=Georgenia sp. SUBG003 TaxID=1497974 RepID=UPI003AB88FA9
MLAVGDTPENIEAYTKQQTRWATGAFEILFRANPLTNRRLSVDQRLQYFGTATFYLGGVVTFALLLLPPLQIFLDLTPIAADLPCREWGAGTTRASTLMQIVVATYTIGSFRWGDAPAVHGVLPDVHPGGWERALAETMLPSRTLVRPLLVVVPKEFDQSMTEGQI